MENIWSRVVKAAEGAALGTETKMEYEVIHGNRPVLANEVGQKLMYENLLAVGGVKYDRKEMKFEAELPYEFQKLLKAIRIN